MTSLKDFLAAAAAARVARAADAAEATANAADAAWAAARAFDRPAGERTMAALHDFLASHTLCHGVGELNEDGDGKCCSIAALNWCLYGEVNDIIYDTESAVIGKWVIKIQDTMPLEMLNSRRWKAALEKLPGLGQKPEKERARLDVILEWMWGTVLPRLQSIADRYGFDEEWKNMLQERTSEAARAASNVAYAAHTARAAASAACAACAAWAPYDACAADAADAACAACAAYAACAAWAVYAAAKAAFRAADPAFRAAACAAAEAARAAAYAASWAAAYAAAYAASWAAADAVARAAGDAARAAWAADFWAEIDPCGLLEKLVTV